MKTGCVILALIMVLTFEARLDAYLDPGSGSMLVQLVLGGVAGAAVILKLGWQRFRDLFRASSTKESETRVDE